MAAESRPQSTDGPNVTLKPADNCYNEQAFTGRNAVRSVIGTTTLVSLKTSLNNSRSQLVYESMHYKLDYWNSIRARSRCSLCEYRIPHAARSGGEDKPTGDVQGSKGSAPWNPPRSPPVRCKVDVNVIHRKTCQYAIKSSSRNPCLVKFSNQEHKPTQSYFRESYKPLDLDDLKCQLSLLGDPFMRRQHGVYWINDDGSETTEQIPGSVRTTLIRPLLRNRWNEHIGSELKVASVKLLHPLTEA